MATPIYVINMAKDVARMASMAQQLEAQGLAFERVEAVVGLELSSDQKKLSYSKFWYGLLMGRRPSDAELGCNLSHRAVWKMIVERGQNFAVIFEDDAELSAGFAAQLAMFEQATRQFDLVQFYSLKTPDQFEFDLGDHQHSVMTYSGANPTATAYAVRLAGAKKLLRFSRILFANDKWVLARAILGVKCGAIFPFPVGMHQTHSALSTISGTSTAKRQGHVLWRVAVLPVLRVLRAVALRIRDV